MKSKIMKNIDTNELSCIPEERTREFFPGTFISDDDLFVLIEQNKYSPDYYKEFHDEYGIHRGYVCSKNKNIYFTIEWTGNKFEYLNFELIEDVEITNKEVTKQFFEGREEKILLSDGRILTNIQSYHPADIFGVCKFN